MTLLHNSITPVAFLVAAAAAAQALGRPITNAVEAHELAVAEALVLDQFDSPDFDLAEALALQEALERLMGHLAFRCATHNVRLDFEALVMRVECEGTARQGALRAGFWPTLCSNTVVWTNYAPRSAEQPCPDLWLGFEDLRWTGRTFMSV